MTTIKICGLTNLSDAQVAAKAGADLLGFIFYEPSPRYVSPEIVRGIVAALRESAMMSAKFVGVFVNASLPTVEQIVSTCGLDAVQLHGNEPPEFVAHFQHRGYKALRPQSTDEAHALAAQYTTTRLSPATQFPALLLDAYHPTLYGGTGHVTDWTMTADLASHYPILLAGSLTPVNVAAAMQTVQPWGVDVSSGIEARKGKKDHAQVRAFINAVRQADLASASNSP